MKVRGHRECKSCGRQWSYYETGSVACPDCGSMQSVGVDERTRHTDSATTLDLSTHRETFESRPREEWATDLKSTLREYRRRRGFIAAGELRPLDETYLAATELLHVADVYGRRNTRTDDERVYLLALLRQADAEDRPAPEAVPPAFTAARGLGYAEAIDEFRGEASTWLDDHPDPEGRKTLGTLREQIKRVQALQGDVSLETSESLVAATRDLWTYLREDDEAALARARDRLSTL